MKKLDNFETVSKIIDILCSLRLKLEKIDGIGIDYDVSGLTVVCQCRHQGGELQNITFQYGDTGIMAEVQK